MQHNHIKKRVFSKLWKNFFWSHDLFDLHFIDQLFELWIFENLRFLLSKESRKKLFSHDKKHLTLQPPQIEIKKIIDGSQFHKLCTWGERFYRYFKTNRFYGWAIVGFLLSARVHNATPIPFCFTRFSSWDQFRWMRWVRVDFSNLEKSRDFYSFFSSQKLTEEFALTVKHT